MPASADRSLDERAPKTANHPEGLRTKHRGSLEFKFNRIPNTPVLRSQECGRDPAGVALDVSAPKRNHMHCYLSVIQDSDPLQEKPRHVGAGNPMLGVKVRLRDNLSKHSEQAYTCPGSCIDPSYPRGVTGFHRPSDHPSVILFDLRSRRATPAILHHSHGHGPGESLWTQLRLPVLVAVVLRPRMPQLLKEDF